MSDERIRILVDQSRDIGWPNTLVAMEPDTVYWTTDNRSYLSCPLLKNYDVLAICGCSPLKYKDEELEAIKKFVESGGGLLLASSTSRFEQDVSKPVSELYANKVAQLFGAKFLPLDECIKESNTDTNLLNGYPREDLSLIPSGALADTDLELDELPVANCGIISVPENAQVFLEHIETKEPIGASMESGKGRIVIINDLEFRRGYPACYLAFKAFIDWLAHNRASRVEGDETIPDEILVDEYVKEDGGVKIRYTDFVTHDRVNTCLRFIKKIEEGLMSMFPKRSDASWDIELSLSCDCRYNWRTSSFQIGALVSDAKLAYALGSRVVNLIDVEGDLEDYGCLGFGTMARCLGMMAMRLLGFQREAEEMYAKIIRQFREKDPTGKGFDVAKVYGYHPKSVWILSRLMDEYGQDALARFAKAVPRGKDLWENIPGSLFSGMDAFIYHLSRGLEVDMYPWFQEMGTTVHSLPLHPNDSDEFKAGVRQYLNDVIRDKSACASDRSDAVCGLMDIYQKEDKPVSDSVVELGLDDRYERLVAGMRLSRSSDSRAVCVLEDLASDEDDKTLAAIAALALVRGGKTSAMDRLVEIAGEQDYRFQFDVGYALHKMGHERADEFSFSGLKDENGDPVVEMKVEYDGHLKLFPTVAGYKVANIFSETHYAHHHFPENTHLSGMYYIDLAHTGRSYRRKGLSRWTMQETFKHRAMRRCSCAHLGTGTRNTAHTMYRSFGFVDVFVGESFYKELRKEKAKIVDGLVIRSYSSGDETQIATLANECYSGLLDQGLVRASQQKPRSPSDYVKVAERDGEMVGYVWASGISTKEDVRLLEIYLKKTDQREEIGLMLLCALHNDLFSHGFKRISRHGGKLMELDFIRRMLYSFGYSAQQIGGVEMFKIINLPMLLKEISSLLATRLKDSDYKDWHGRIDIAGDQHKSSIIIKDGEISVSEDVLADPDILISADDDTITRIMFGRMTPFEAYLQIELDIKPMVNDRVTGLLEVLFPRIPKQD